VDNQTEPDPQAPLPASAQAGEPTSGDAAKPEQKKRGWFRRIARFVGCAILIVVIFSSLAWSTLALYYAGLSGGRPPRTLAASGFALFGIVALLLARPRKLGLIAFSLAFVGVLIWFFTILPANNRDWSPDVAVLPYATFEGDFVTIHNIRNFDYRSETDFTPAYEDRTYDLRKLKSLDLVLSFWGSPLIAHTIACFGFDGGQYVDMSIETRKERTESYSAVQGFFRQYELAYVIADERDVLRLRTNYRNEDVYLFRTNTPPERARAIFADYLKGANKLREHPEFYNALTTNCTTNMLPHLKAANPAARLRWELLLNGYSARLAYDNGHLDSSMPYEQLFVRSHINDAAKAADQDPNFSLRIRANLPAPKPRDR